jgi:hypothetical protein
MNRSRSAIHSLQARAVLALLLCGSALLGAARDPGIRLELDLAHFELRARDLRDGSAGPVLRVVTGSPAHPTPTGTFPLHRVVRNPSWTPGPMARSRGAREIAASSDGPLGVAKIPFGPAGFGLHGGAKRLLLGKPASLGCVRALDAELLALLDWLEDRGALGARRSNDDGEITQPIARPARIHVR